MPEKIKQLEEKVFWVLEHIEETRNDDVVLTMQIIANYLPEEIKLIEGKYFVSVHALKRVRESEVGRIRRRIQRPNILKNYLGQFLPTDAKVREQRDISEFAWEEYSRSKQIIHNPL